MHLQGWWNNTRRIRLVLIALVTFKWSMTIQTVVRGWITHQAFFGLIVRRLCTSLITLCPWIFKRWFSASTIYRFWRSWRTTLYQRFHILNLIILLPSTIVTILLLISKGLTQHWPNVRSVFLLKSILYATIISRRRVTTWLVWGYLLFFILITMMLLLKLILLWNLRLLSIMCLEYITSNAYYFSTYIRAL